MATINSYKELIVWQKAVDLTVEVYKLSSQFPKEEVYALTSQIRRAACSISLNIAEGFGRNTTKSYVSFLYIAEGSLREVEAAVILSNRLGFVNESSCEKVNSLIVEEMKMFNVLIKKLEEKIK